MSVSDPLHDRSASNRQDLRWGRSPGAAPPLTPRATLVAWLISAAALVAIVVVAVGSPGPLDDPGQGDQRPGILTGQADSERVTGLRLPGSPIGRRPVVVVFARTVPDPRRLSEFLNRAPTRFARIIALPLSPRRDLDAPVVIDQGARLARRLGMPQPTDGGYPIGYALIDSSGHVRYATLDSTFSEHGSELATLAGVLR